MSADRKALLTAAIDALTRAAEACAAADVPTAAGWRVQPGEDLGALLKARAEEALALLVAAEQPIALGDTVRVSDGRGRWSRARLEKVARVWVTVGRSQYDVDHGTMKDRSQHSIHPHDLARIKRWLCKPAKAVQP